MRITVLGSAGTHPGPGRACSSYLVESDGYRLLLDAGNGSMGNLLQVCAVTDIDAVLLSHVHIDHWADLVGLYIARRWHEDGPFALPFYGPAGASSFIGQVVSGDPEWARMLPFTAAAAGDVLRLGPLRVELFAANHPVETLASRISGDGVVVTYSGDSGRSDELTAAAKNADLFIADCSWPDTMVDRPPDMHMSGREAGLQAEEAGVGTLVVAHVVPGDDPADRAAEVAAHFGGETVLAVDLQVHTP